MGLSDFVDFFSCKKEKERQKKADEAIAKKMQEIEDDDTDWNEAKEHLKQVSDNIERLSQQIKKHG